MPRYTVDQNRELLVEYMQPYVSLKSMAEKYNVTPQAIFSRLCKFPEYREIAKERMKSGARIYWSKKDRKPKVVVTTEQDLLMFEDYKKPQATLKSIAKKYKIPYSAIRDRLCNIPGYKELTIEKNKIRAAQISRKRWTRVRSQENATGSNL